MERLSYTQYIPFIQLYLAQLDEEFPNDRREHPPHPGDGGAGAHRRVPDGGGVELGGVHEGDVEGGSRPQFCPESQDGVEDCAGLQEGGHYQVRLIIGPSSGLVFVTNTTDPGYELGSEEHWLPSPDINLRGKLEHKCIWGESLIQTIRGRNM